MTASHWRATLLTEVLFLLFYFSLTWGDETVF